MQGKRPEVLELTPFLSILDDRQFYRSKVDSSVYVHGRLVSFVQPKSDQDLSNSKTKARNKGWKKGAGE